MYLWAHLFTGILIGLLLCRIQKDRRMLVACSAGSLLPDLLDKPLSLLLPGLFGSTRTFGHTLLFAGLILVAAILLFSGRQRVSGLAAACLVLVHQVQDMLWTEPVTWFFPAYGWFARELLPGGLSRFLWLEFTSLSEWVFALASCFLLLRYAGEGMAWPRISPGRTAGLLLYGTAALLGVTGLFLVSTGMEPAWLVVPGLEAGPDKTFMAGLTAACGALALVLLAGQERQGTG